MHHSEGAERTRRYRERQQQGLRMVRVPVAEGVVRALIAQGYLEARRDDGGLRVARADIGVAIAAVLEEWAAP